jgi:hypothetical protein
MPSAAPVFGPGSDGFALPNATLAGEATMTAAHCVFEQQRAACGDVAFVAIGCLEEHLTGKAKITMPYVPGLGQYLRDRICEDACQAAREGRRPERVRFGEGLASGLLTRWRGMQLQAERAHYLEDGGELWVAARRECLVQTFATEASFPRDLRHTLCSCDVTEGSCDKSRVTLLQRCFQIRSHICLSTEVFCRIPLRSDGLGHFKLLVTPNVRAKRQTPACRRLSAWAKG